MRQIILLRVNVGLEMHEDRWNALTNHLKTGTVNTTTFGRHRGQIIRPLRYEYLLYFKFTDIVYCMEELLYSD